MFKTSLAAITVGIIIVLSNPAAFGMSDREATSRAEAMEILVLGGTRETGLDVVRLLSERGDNVTAMARPTSNTEALEKLGVPIVIGDAFDRESLDRIMAKGNFTAVISTFGAQREEKKKVDFEGNRNAIDAAKAAGVTRYIMVTMIGSGDSHDAISDEIRNFFNEVLELKTAAEDYLMASGLDYTILRPGGLVSKPATGRGMLSEDRSMMGVIHRADLAQLAINCLDDPATIGRIYATVDEDMIGAPELQLPAARE